MRYLTILLMSILISACQAGRPYEVKSPCAAIDSINAEAINPCVRRPVNSDYII